MIDELDLEAERAVDTRPPRARAGAVAWALGALIVGTVVAVDPGGLVPTGPLRWTAIA